MDDKGQESGHLMLITPERVFYAGLLGRPRQRCSGAFHVYVAIQGGLWLTIADGRESYGELVVVPPNVPHTIASDHRSVICLVIEPESVRPGAFEELAKRLSGPEAPFFARRIRQPMSSCCSGRVATTFPAPNSTSMCLAKPAAAPLDPRVARSIAADRQILRRAGDGSKLRRGGRIVAVALPASVQGGDRHLVPLLPRLEARAASAAFRQPGHQSCASGAGYRLSRLHAFQPFDPPLLRAEAARDLFRLARSCDLPQQAVAGAGDSAWTQEAG